MNKDRGRMAHENSITCTVQQDGRGSARGRETELVVARQGRSRWQMSRWRNLVEKEDGRWQSWYRWQDQRGLGLGWGEGCARTTRKTLMLYEAKWPGARHTLCERDPAQAREHRKNFDQQRKKLIGSDIITWRRSLCMFTHKAVTSIYDTSESR